jgi:OTU domain-containing protein 5
VNRKRQNHLHGNHIEIQAMSEMYNRPVELYCYDLTPINIFNAEQSNNGYEPLRLSYHRSSHYNCIVNPLSRSVGVGLGLSGYRPEDFDPTKQINDACQMSEQLEIEKMMVEDKLKTTDWEATSDVVVEQIARQSYLQFCKENMNKKIDGNKCSTSTVTSTEAGSCSSSSSAMPLCEASTVAGQQQKESCSSDPCDSEQNKSPYVQNYYKQATGRRSKKRHHHHHHS